MAKRDYGNKLPSVTTVLGVLRKIGLEVWFKRNTAEFCNRISRRGREIGIEIHETIQNHIEEGKVKIETQYGEEIKNALESFMLFKKEHPRVKLKRSEVVLTSKKHGYNGTLDCLGNDGVPVLFDWKSGECKEKDKPPIYEDHVYQTAAYVEGYNEQEGADIGKAYIVALAKDKVAYNLRIAERNELKKAFKKVFLPALSIYNYQKGR